MSRFVVTVANPTDKTISLPFFFRLSTEGFGEEHDKKLKGNGFGRAVARSECGVRYGAVELEELPQNVPSVRGSLEPPRRLCVTTSERSALEKGSRKVYNFCTKKPQTKWSGV